MIKKKLCIRCGKRPATIPDRNQMGRPIKRVCRRCHVEQLQGDFQRILDVTR